MREIARRLSMVAIAATVPCLMAMAAEPRVALVIGNAEYEHAPLLNNPLNDAADVTAALERLGFAVTLLENADQTALRRGLQQFARAASVARFAAVYYAGHGIEVDRRNFLVPVDARLASDADTEFETVPLDLVIQSVSRASFRLVILDACRENPFARKMQTAGSTRSIGRGLALIEPPGGTLVAYAAKEGTLAEDGEGRNSPYAHALLRFLEQPNLEVGMMFRHVRDDVLSATGGRQEPYTYGSLPKEGIYFQSSRSDPTNAEPVAPPEPAAQAPSDSPRPEPQPALVVVELDEFRWTTQAVDVYADPSDASAVLLSLEPLVEVNVIGAVRGAPWLRVAPDTGGTGYIAAAALSDQYPVVDADGVYRVVRRANVRGGPGVTYEAVSRLDAGTDVRVTGKFLNTDWLRVVTASGEGYVKATALSDQFPVEAASGTYRATRRTDVRSGLRHRLGDGGAAGAGRRGGGNGAVTGGGRGLAARGGGFWPCGIRRGPWVAGRGGRRRGVRAGARGRHVCRVRGISEAVSERTARRGGTAVTGESPRRRGVCAGEDQRDGGGVRELSEDVSERAARRRSASSTEAGGREAAVAAWQAVSGLRRVSRNGRGAGGVVHDGVAGFGGRS